MELALNGVATTTPSTPFFRFPFFEMSQSSLDHLQKRGIMVFGAGVFADDRIKAPADAQLKRIVEREAAAKGILLLHDSEEHTAAVLPAFLRYLRDNRYRVGHVVSRTPAKATAGTKT